MNMKDAFRFQNKLKGLMCEATAILQDRRNIVKVKTTHLRSKVMSDTQDAVVEEAAPSEYAGHANEVAAFLMSLLEEREKLCRAIHAAKNSLDLDMDSEVGLNRQRQDLAEVFRHMTMLRNSEKTIAGGGSGKRPLPAEAPASDSTARETRSPTDVMPRRSPPSTLTGTRSGAWLRRSARRPTRSPCPWISVWSTPRYPMSRHLT